MKAEMGLRMKNEGGRMNEMHKSFGNVNFLHFLSGCAFTMRGSFFILHPSSFILAF
jgi:hypothetical protein